MSARPSVLAVRNGFCGAVIWHDRSLDVLIKGYPVRRDLRGPAVHGPIGPAVGSAAGVEARLLGRT